MLVLLVGRAREQVNRLGPRHLAGRHFLVRQPHLVAVIIVGDVEAGAYGTRQLIRREILD